MSEVNERPSWGEYFMNLVGVISQRSTCDRGKPGCIFVKDNQILSSGYAGSPPGFHHCDEAGHLMEVRIRTVNFDKGENVKEFLKSFIEVGQYSTHCIRTIHAEQNAILQAAKKGISLEGSTVYVSMTPCRTCAMMLISVGVKTVVCGKLYQKAQESIDMFKSAQIPIIHLDDSVQKY